MKKYFNALSILLNNANNIFFFLKSKKKYINKSINEISYKEIYAKQNVPKFNNSAMDGYAVISEHTKNIDKENEFFVLKTIPAEKKIEYKVIKKNTVSKIMTGAKIPDIFNAVVKKEDTEILNKKKIIIKKNIKVEENIRIFGSDYKKNDILLNKGEIIKTSHILTLSATGIKLLNILIKPKIYMICSGNEITDKIIKKTNENIIFNSSGPYIKNFLKNIGFEVIYLGLTKDDKKKFLEKIEPILSNEELSIIITTGAVSVGSFDFISEALKSIKTKILFHGVKIKPGKPILFGKYKKNKYFFCLPGNPASSIIGTRFFIYPFLRQTIGIHQEKPIKAKLKTEYKLKIKFDSFLKAFCYCENSVFYVKILDEQDSFKTFQFCKSNAFVLLKQKDQIKINDLIDVYFYNPLNL